VLHGLEAQAGAVHMRVLRTFVGRHLRKSMGELHIVSSSIPLPPTLVFAGRIKHALDVPVDRSHDADAREHRWPVMFCDQQ
jgi:hypothetical protein